MSDKNLISNIAQRPQILLQNLMTNFWFFEVCITTYFCRSRNNDFRKPSCLSDFFIRCPWWPKYATLEIFQGLVAVRGWCIKFATGLKCLNIHRSKSIWVTSLFFCQNDSLIGGSLWQKDSLVTLILFELCLLWYLAQSQILVTSLYTEYTGYLIANCIK